LQELSCLFTSNIVFSIL